MIASTGYWFCSRRHCGENLSPAVCGYEAGNTHSLVGGFNSCRGDQLPFLRAQEPERGQRKEEHSHHLIIHIAGSRLGLWKRRERTWYAPPLPTSYLSPWMREGGHALLHLPAPPPRATRNLTVANNILKLSSSLCQKPQLSVEDHNSSINSQISLSADAAQCGD